MTPWVLTMAMLLAGWQQASPKPDAAKQAQPKQDDLTVFRSDTSLVYVPFSVLDAKDRIVTDLKQENFKVYEDGKLMDIKAFTAITKVPLRVGLLIDTSNSVRLYFKQQQEAAIDFIHAVSEANNRSEERRVGKECRL